MKFSFPLIKNLEELKRLLDAGLQRLKLDENFQNFQVTVTIPNGSEAKIANQLKSLPKKRIIIRQSGNGLVTDGDTPWDLDNVYLKNHGPADTTITVLFLE